MAHVCYVLWLLPGSDSPLSHEWQRAPEKQFLKKNFIRLTQERLKKAGGGWRARLIGLPCCDYFLFIEADSGMRRYWKKVGTKTRVKHGSCVLSTFIWGEFISCCKKTCISPFHICSPSVNNPAFKFLLLFYFFAIFPPLPHTDNPVLVLAVRNGVLNIGGRHV